MQVASIFRETAKLLGASMDGNSMDNNGKYCLKSGGQLDDGYETCVDPQVGGLCNPNHVERMMAPGMDHGGMRHLQMDHQSHMNHHHHHHHSHQQPPPPQHPQHHQHHSLPPGHPGLRPGHMPGMKLEQYNGDPYSFVEESNSNNMCIPNNNNNNNMNMNNTHNNMPPQAKKRGRKKKPDLATMNQMDSYGNGQGGGKQGNGRNGGGNGGDKEFHPPDVKERKRHDRFNGVSEEEVSKRTVPDHLAPNLDVVIVGINPGLFAAYKGHHYAGPGNHFWKCLYLSGLVPEPFTAEDDSKLLRQGIGFTNMVSRPTKGSADLTRREIKQGSRILQEKLQKYQPKVAVFNGKLIYEVFSGKKDFPFGRQPEFVEGTNTYIWVMPSSSARCAQLPRAADKVPFYAALKKFRDYLNGLITEIDDSEIVFPDSKPLPKSLTAPLEQKKSTESNHCSGPDEGGQPGFPSETPNKKKRGRPRKGMEKHPPGPKKEKLPKMEGDMKKSCAGGGNNMHYDNGSKRTGAEPPERKRRGRPKKTKVESNSSPSFSVRSSGTPDIMMDNGNHHMPVTCPPPTASSVSSGYSTATSTTEERTRRSEENSSISNTGSGGPSPSHHSYTTQSDLSSEISAAISCGSPPQSPSNNHSDNIFDGLSGMVNHRDDRSNQQQQQQQQQQQHYTKMENHQNSKGHSQQHHMSEVSCNSNENNDGMYMNSSLDHQPQDGPPAFSPYHHHPGLDSRSMSRNAHYPAPMSRGSSSSTNTPTSSSSGAYHGHGSFEPPAAPPPARTSFDVASKSLSGLESLVDQIPSISEAEAGMGHPPPGLPAGLLPESIPHSASGSSSSASIANPLAHSHYSDSPSAGFLPYGTPTSSYANPSHYGSPSYYPSDLSSSFPVNSLATPSTPYQPSSFFGYPGYHAGQYGSSHSSSSYSHASAAAAAAASLHLHSSSPYGSALGYPSPYSNPSAYMHQSSLAPGPPSSANGRYPQRLHLRQDGMDIGSMGFGGF